MDSTLLYLGARLPDRPSRLLATRSAALSPRSPRYRRATWWTAAAFTAKTLAESRLPSSGDAFCVYVFESKPHARCP